MKARALTLLFRCAVAAILLDFGNASAQPSMNEPPVRVEGVITEGGVVCPLLKADGGEVFPLQGVARDRHPPGTRLVLEGRFVRVSVCRQGPKTLQVERIIQPESGQ